MTDPWTGVREKAKHMNKEELYTSLRDLLIDSYALLAMMPFTGHKPWCTYCDCGFFEALAALPEHLRGDNDEQSRKA